MKSNNKIVLCFLLSLTLLGCSSQGTIAGLESENIESEHALNFDNLDHEGVREQYEELIDLVDDEYLKEQIKRRIAGVNMQAGDDSQTKPGIAPKQGYYREAIASYKDILEKYPNSPDNAEVLYQLAKAYDLEGQVKNAQQMLTRLVRLHPYYINMSEVYFRLGDIYFNSGRYKKAEHAYEQTTLKDKGSLILNAHYMQAWSLYKLGNYDQALHHFAYVLNDLLMAQSNGRKLNNIEKPLIQDALHSMSLALVNLGGAQAIEDIKLLKNKQYVWRLYNELAAFYEEKSRFDDSAASYREFVKRYPNNKCASNFHSKLIAIYVKGAFPKLVLAEKQIYSMQYAPDSDYFKQHKNQQLTIKGNLKKYYIELAGHFHSQGQQALRQYKQSKKDHLQELANKSLNQAADYYGRFIQTFTTDTQLASLHYKKADAHFENNQFAQAAMDYVKVAYSYGRHQLRSKAAYASIIAFEKHIATLVSEDKQHKDLASWRARSVDNMLKFAKVHHQDKRSIAVLSNASQALFALSHYDRAIKVASNLIKGRAKLNKQFKQTAYGIIAHSYFQKQQYQLAQNNYTQQRKLLKKGGKAYIDVSKQLAASVYKKAHELHGLGQSKPAIKALLSIKKLAPNTNTRIVAQYDAVSMMLTAKEWPRAIKELLQLKKKYKQHELSANFPRKLAFAYEQNQQWKKAAGAYSDLFKRDKDAAVRQEALFISAGLFKKIGKTKKAIAYFRDYAHKYEKPFDNRMEARFELANLYEMVDDKTRQLFWLRRVIAGDETATQERTDRSRWLGAWANTKYGDYFSWEFNRRKLRLPIQTSMMKKNQFLQDAIVRYDMASAYGILEFVSMANFKSASLYERFSGELSRAPTPKNLSKTDLDLYKQIINEQAQPFSDLAGSVYQANIELSWQGHFNQWIEKSYDAMKRVSPARFGKVEEIARYGDEIR